MHVFYWSLFSCAFLQLCSAQTINCTGEPNPLNSDQTIYRISEGSRVPDVKTLGCNYSWKDKSTVLAHQTKSLPELVVNNSVNDLITSKCFDSVAFNRLCKSEGVGYTAICTTNCTLNALLRSQKLEATVEPTGGNQTGDTIRTPHLTDAKIAVIVVSVVVVLLLAVGAGFLCYKCKKRISRRFSSRPFSCIYSALKKQTVDS